MSPTPSIDCRSPGSPTWYEVHERSCPRTGGANEDATFWAPIQDGRVLLAAVADGVGGRPGSAAASRRAIRYARRHAEGAVPTLLFDPGAWRMALEAIHARMCRHESGGASTLTVLLTDGRRWTCAWVGDSHLYSGGGQRAETLTATGEKTGYLGGDHILARARTGTLRGGERLLLATDGIWKFVRHETLQTGLAGAPREILPRLFSEAARTVGGKLADDASGVVVSIVAEPDAAPAPDAAPPGRRRRRRRALRALPATGSIASLDRLELDPLARERLERVIGNRTGTIVLAGPTGSGKTTTGHAILEGLAGSAVVVAVECPVERAVPGVAHVDCEWHEMADRLRRACDHLDTDVLKGKMEDREQAEVLLRFGASGRLAVGSMHAPGAAAVIGRLADQGSTAALVAASLALVQAQRLLRRLCAACRVPARPSAVLLEALGIDGALLSKLRVTVPPVGAPVTLFRPAGCPACGGTGYSAAGGPLDRHVVACESLALTPPVHELVLAAAPAPRIHEVARQQGMWTLRESALRHALLGLTSLEEVGRVTPP
jgi:serine/threonine protein phosphatase PrpC